MIDISTVNWSDWGEALSAFEAAGGPPTPMQPGDNSTEYYLEHGHPVRYYIDIGKQFELAGFLRAARGEQIPEKASDDLMEFRAIFSDRIKRELEKNAQEHASLVRGHMMFHEMAYKQRLASTVLSNKPTL